MKPQTEQLYEHMKKHGSITQHEAYELYGNTRAAAAVFEMRKAGIPVVTEKVCGVNRFGDRCRYARFWIERRGA